MSSVCRQLHLGHSKKDLSKPGNARRLNGKFRGMVLERLSGETLAEELAARRSGVQDVHFIREVLFQVRSLFRNRMQQVHKCTGCIMGIRTWVTAR